MKRESVNPPNDWGSMYMLDQGQLISETKRTLYLSGQVALETDPESELGAAVKHEGDMRQQIIYVLSKIDNLLNQANMSRENIIFVRFYSTDNGAFLENYDVYAEWIGGAGVKPPQSDIGISELAVPGLLIEIEVVAAD